MPGDLKEWRLAHQYRSLNVLPNPSHLSDERLKELTKELEWLHQRILEIDQEIYKTAWGEHDP
jgi:hypothetical protein